MLIYMNWVFKLSGR